MGCAAAVRSVVAIVAAAPLVAASGEIQLASVHAVVGDLERGEILYSKRDDIEVPIASVTKLMTAMVVLDSGRPLDEWVPIVRRGDSYGKNFHSRLRIGSQSTRGQLLRLALMSSENLASYVLAVHHPGGVDAFVEAMNAKARELGMSRTRFGDPTGLSTTNRSTAADLFTLARAAYGYETIREYSTTYQYTARFRDPHYTLGFGNTNPLTASGRWEVGMSKTGYLTEAGRCLVMVADIGGAPVGMVLLNSFGTRTPLGDAARVRRWLETGSSGRVAGAALEYERRLAASYDRSVGLAERAP
ncbi:MAG TPA: D-alanyl-D-alanine endopeptidase [Candidatus Polarisedimenticolaceae bacterium]|nr:D-alanyl-D-alanine endopeptidase [Candidatus Polarisedimenticolaceae bacterium]